MKFSITESPFGHFGIVYDSIEGEEKAIRILLPDERESILTKVDTEYPSAVESEQGMLELIDLISRYLNGEPITIPLSFVDQTICSRFQLRVLLSEREIPYGKTATYSWLAKKAGIRSPRAVGSALARNPFPIVVPCHRAIRSDRTVGGFQGGGRMKRAFLIMEGVRFDDIARVVEEDLMR